MVRRRSKLRPKRVPYLKRRDPPFNFLGLPKKYSGYKKAKVVIQPLPYEGTVSYMTGTSYGPRAIIDASRFVEDFDVETKRSFRQAGIHTLPFLKPPKRYSAPAPYIRRVYLQTKQLLKDHKFVISLGGEHSLSAGIIRAYSEQFKSFCVLHLDAHADLRDAYEGSSFSHASGLRRASELAKTVHVGLRTLSQDQWDYIRKKKLKVFFSHELLKKSRKRWISEIVKVLDRNVYVTVDTDVLDPTDMPATGTPEPGGLHYDDLIDVIRTVSRKKNIVGFDVMELAPIEGISFPDFTCARLVYQTIAWVMGKKVSHGS